MVSVRPGAGSPRRWLSNGYPSVRARLIVGFVVFFVILACVAGTAAWQTHEHQATLAELESHSRTASLLEQSDAEAGTAALLLQRYVTVRDDTYVPEIESHANTAVSSLTAAISSKGVVDVRGLAASGIGLSEGAGQILALRQSGNAEGAAAAMEEIVPQFRQFRLGLEDAATAELQKVSDLRSQADSSGQLALWLLIISGSIGALTGLATAVLIGRSIIRPLSSLQETAASVESGNLSTRAPVTGPTELRHLGSMMNDMLTAVEKHAQELSAANKELAKRNRQLTDARAQAATDSLTALGNHRAFHKRIREDIAQAETLGSSLSLIIFDIDEFKGFNDTLGHLAGDEILRQMALTLCKVVNQQDAYRYGGDEFAIVVQDAGCRGAAAAAERLRAAIEAMVPDDGQKLTVSLGVASYPEMASSAEELVYRADMAMYWAKSTGKNRVGDWDGLLSRRTDVSAAQNFAGRDGKLRDAIVSLVSALAAKDPATRDHVERCAWYTTELAKELRLDDQEASVVRLASLLHDIGKLVVPPEVLGKPGPLTSEEWAQMKQYPTTALHILGTIDSVADAVPAIVHHHEHFDGSGYPDGLRGQDIPIASRIISVADAFDAMTTDRPFRQAMSVESAIEELKSCSDSQFDPTVVEAFVRVISRDGAHPLRPMAGAAARDTANQP